MEIPFDFRILALIGIYLTLLYKFLKNDFVENIQKHIIEEIEKDNEKYYSNAQRIVNTKKISAREKNFIKRRLNNCTARYNASDWIRSIPGISIICVVFCAFLLFAVLIYSLNESVRIIDAILLCSQLILFVIALLVWLVHKANINTKNIYNFLFFSFLYGIIAIFWGSLIAILNICFPVIPTTIVTYLLYACFSIPLIPVFIAVCSTMKINICERYSYSRLRKSIIDYQSGKLKQKLKKTQI